MTANNDVPPRRRHRVAGLAALGAAAVLALTACAGGDSSTSSSPAKAPAQDQSRQSGGSALAEPESKAGAPAQDSAGKVNLDQSQLYLVKQARISLKVNNIARAATSVRAAGIAAGGSVLSEHIGGSIEPVQPQLTDRNVTATNYGEIVLSVPASKLDTVLDQLSQLGNIISRESSSDDVKQQFIDTDSRLKTMRASVDRVRALMTRATDLTQIVALESELSRRQADLESLESQLASLKNSIAQSPITVSLATDPALVNAPGDDAGGFLSGLKGGWSAFTTSLRVALTVVGAVLPFAVLLAVLAIPALWWWRRLRANQPPPAVQAPINQ